MERVARFAGASSGQLRRLSRRKPKVAIVQFEGVHEEVIPSVARALARCGVDCDIYVNACVLERRGDLLGSIPETKGKVRYPEINRKEDWEKLQADVLSAGYDALFLNTLQRDGVADWASRTGLPILGIIHNPKLFLSSPKCVSLLESGSTSVFSLAPHVTAWMLDHSPELFAKAGTLSLNYWDMHEGATFKAREGSPRRIVIPGSVNFANRDYLSVIEAIPQLITEATEDFEIGILGGGPDRTKLEKIVTEAGCAAHVRFATKDPVSGFVDNATYFSELALADFVLPMLPEQRTDYRTFKITSAVPTSVAFRIPAILDSWTAAVYGAPCVTYRGEAFLDGLRRAVVMERADLGVLREKLGHFRTTTENQSFEEMRRGLSQLSII